MPQARPTPQLCICDDATFLPWLTWPDVATLPDKEKIVVLVPIAGFANWGADLPLDAEEQVLMRVLKAASAALRERSDRSGGADALSSESQQAAAAKVAQASSLHPIRFQENRQFSSETTAPLAHAHSHESQRAEFEKSSYEREPVVRTLTPTQTRTLMVSPLRFIAAGGPDSDCAFAVDVPVALSFIDEVCASLAASGFSRVVLCNASPWNEELCDAAARDIRIARGLQMFCVNLSALGLDFNFTRGGEADRTRIASVLANGDFVSEAGAHMAALLTEIAARSPLKNNGLLMAVSAPTLPESSAKQEGST